MNLFFETCRDASQHGHGKLLVAGSAAIVPLEHDRDWRASLWRTSSTIRSSMSFRQREGGREYTREAKTLRHARTYNTHEGQQIILEIIIDRRAYRSKNKL